MYVLLCDLLVVVSVGGRVLRVYREKRPRWNPETKRFYRFVCSPNTPDHRPRVSFSEKPRSAVAARGHTPRTPSSRPRRDLNRYLSTCPDAIETIRDNAGVISCVGRIVLNTMRPRRFPRKRRTVKRKKSLSDYRSKKPPGPLKRFSGNSAGVRGVIISTSNRVRGRTERTRVISKNLISKYRISVENR